jgi:hypothetical protein
LCATDAKQTQFSVATLKTPLGVYNQALLRRSDIRTIEIPLSGALLSSLCGAYARGSAASSD